MKNFLFAILCVGLVASACNSTKSVTSSSNTVKNNPNYSYSGGNGTSFEDAVIINEKSEGTGVNAEYAWLKVHYPGYKMGSQGLHNQNSKHYDVLDFTTANGSSKKIYFDITNFFGKF